MNKITLMNIMESLSDDSMDEAETSIHEWFIDIAKNAHLNLTSVVAESEEADEDKAEETVEEARVDELSPDAMHTYAKLARKDRDRSEDDEVVGRRVSGLNMVSQKARKLRTQPQYESEEDPEFVDACQKARDASKEGFVQHVDKLDGGGYSVSDWMSDDTVSSYSNGNHIGGEDPLPMETKEPTDVPDVGVDSLEFTPEPTFESLMAELTEDFTGLETCSDKLQNVEGAQVGNEGKVTVNKKSTLPIHKALDRVGGKAVEIKSNGHKGHSLEKAPKVASAPVSTKNSEAEMAEVKTDKSTLLNTAQGKINTTSLISGKGAKGLK